MRIIIRLVSAVTCLTGIYFWHLNNDARIGFTAISFLLVFLGTFVVAKGDSKTGHQISQKGGHFSKNIQKIEIGAEK